MSPSFLRTTPAKKPRTECDCQPVDSHDGGDRGAVRPTKQPQHPRLLRIRPRPVMRTSALASAGLGPGFGGGARLDGRARLRFDMSKLLSMVRAQQRAAPPKPRGGPTALAGREERAGQAQRPDTTHALFTTEVECKMSTRRSSHSSENSPCIPDARSSDAVCFSRQKSSAEIWAGAANPYQQLKRERSPPPGLRLPQTKLSRNSNRIARGRIRRLKFLHAQPRSRSARAPLRPVIRPISPIVVWGAEAVRTHTMRPSSVLTYPETIRWFESLQATQSVSA